MASCDLILLGQGPSMTGCPCDIETWATLTVLSHKEWEDKPFSKVFCFDRPNEKEDEAAGLVVARRRGLPIVGLSAIATYPPAIEQFITEEYPLRDLMEKYHTYYFKNDMSYMIAYAVLRGYKHLSLWGVDQSGPEMYTMARPYVMFWLGIATGEGVKWELSPTSVLLREDD